MFDSDKYLLNGWLMPAKKGKAVQLRLIFALVLVWFFAGIAFPLPRFLLFQIG
jgi:hypothetical protein